MRPKIYGSSSHAMRNVAPFPISNMFLLIMNDLRFIFGPNSAIYAGHRRIERAG
jgi:hypothetical protein